MKKVVFHKINQKYQTKHLDKKKNHVAPLVWLTLVNPCCTCVASSLSDAKKDRSW